MVNANCYLLVSSLVGIMAESSTFHWIMHVIHPGCGSVTVLSSILSVLLHDIRLIMLWTQYFCLFLFNWCVGFFMTESIWDCFSDGCDRAFRGHIVWKKKGYFNKIPPRFFGFFFLTVCASIYWSRKRKRGNRHFSNIIFIV